MEWQKQGFPASGRGRDGPGRTVIRDGGEGEERVIIDGIVEQGKHLGRRLGFPTANIRPDRIAGEWPENGVYVAALWLEGEARAYLCMLNQGLHPTAPEGKPTVEAHVLDFGGDIYGRAVRVEYLHFLRPEHRFADLEALTAQLNQDRVSAHQWLAAAQAGLADSPEARRARAIRWRRA